MDWIDPHLRKLIYSSVVAAVSICGQFTTVLMATEPSTTTASATPGVPKAQWNVPETNALLAHLLKNISEAGDGANFKGSTWTSAATALATAVTLSVATQRKVTWMGLLHVTRKVMSQCEESTLVLRGTIDRGLKSIDSRDSDSSYNEGRSQGMRGFSLKRLAEVALIKSIEQEVCLGMESKEDTLLRVIRDVIAAIDEGGESCILDIRIPECVKEWGVTEGLLERAQRD
ncbi:hypothetical protein DFH29DRAFT_1007554 [Suillus ampliporus]|nr:hypothetical protein DFH29DRAFT_1007554 [Suillus ampliporus]